MNYGIVIRRLRKERGLNQGELAARAGIKQPNVSRLENGYVEARASTISKIAAALNIYPGVIHEEANKAIGELLPPTASAIYKKGYDAGYADAVRNSAGAGI